MKRKVLVKKYTPPQSPSQEGESEITGIKSPERAEI